MTPRPARPTRPPKLVAVLLLAVLVALVAGCGAVTSTPAPTRAPTASPTTAASTPPPAPATPTPTGTPTPTATPTPTKPPPLGVYLAPFGKFPAKTLQSLAAFYKKTYNLKVTILKATPIPAAARDADRKQVIAEELVRALPGAYPKVAAETGAVIIGLVADDVYIRSRTDWAWAFGVRGTSRYAVVSTFRMKWPGNASSATQLTRLRKMVTRDLGVLYWGFKLNDDRNSVLWVNIGGVDDLDRVTEKLPPLPKVAPGTF